MPSSFNRCSAQAGREPLPVNICSFNFVFTYLSPVHLNPNSDFRNLPFGPKPVLRKLSEHLFGVKPRHLQRNKFVALKVETRPRLTRQMPKLVSEGNFGIWAKWMLPLPRSISAVI